MSIRDVERALNKAQDLRDALLIEWHEGGVQQLADGSLKLSRRFLSALRMASQLRSVRRSVLEQQAFFGVKQASETVIALSGFHADQSEAGQLKAEAAAIYYRYARLQQ